MTIWQRFRVWRRSRPFWGGLLTLLAGLEIFGSMNLEINGGTIEIGQEGFASYLVVMVLVLCGALAWFTPQQRHFYGLLAALVAVYSLIGVNLGGFFLGMLLGVAGGGLIFAWNPEVSSDDEQAQGVPDEDAVENDEVPSIFLRDGVPAPQEEQREEQEQGPKASSPRHAIMIIMVVAMSVSMLAVMGAQTRAHAADPCGQPAPAPSASPSPSPSASGGSGSGGIVGQIVDFFGQLLGGGNQEAQPASSTSPSPSTTPTPSPCPTSPPDPGGPGTPPGNPTSPKPSTPKAKVLAAAPDQVPVARKPSKMTGTRIQMTDLVFDGIVNLPTIDGTIRVLKFTLTSSDTNDFLLHTYNTGGGTFDTNLRCSKLTVSGGGVQFFTTRFQGKLLGVIPVDYTPENPPLPVPLASVFFTEPDIELVWVDSPVLKTGPDLRITLAKP